ncbi:MAG TPA: hypothetical protein PKA46_11570 [Ferruginibacter sp.]|nr:hypothetical protein [Ferruginibacter sp.]
MHISTAANIPNTNGNCQTNNAFTVAGSFTIDAGGFTGISINTLILKNSGTATEGANIPNSALNVFYEPATGNEIYGDGNEVYAGNLNGNWDGNTDDNIFGSTTLNIPVNGKIRVYVLLCSYNSPSADGKTINLGFINDGIFLSPAMDGFTKMRINPGSISQKNITLPVRFVHINGIRKQQDVQLNWTAVYDIAPVKFIIQQSADGNSFTEAGEILLSPVYNTRTGRYTYTLRTDALYFRIIAVHQNAEKHYSNTIHIRHIAGAGIVLLQNPVHDAIILDNRTMTPGRYSFQLADALGRRLMSQTMYLTNGINKLPLPSNISPQVLWVQLADGSGNTYKYKLLKQ